MKFSEKSKGIHDFEGSVYDSQAGSVEHLGKKPSYRPWFQGFGNTVDELV